MDKQESRSTLKTAAIAAAIIMFCMFGACATCMGAAGTAAVEATEKREEQKKQAEADLQQQLAACAQSEATPWSSYVAALEANEAAAQASWTNYCQKVTGKVARISSGIGDVPQVIVGSGKRFEAHELYCEPQDPGKAMSLSKGQTITVWGSGGREFAGNLILENCQW